MYSIVENAELIGKSELLTKFFTPENTNASTMIIGKNFLKSFICMSMLDFLFL